MLHSGDSPEDIGGVSGEVDGTKRRVYWINGRSLGWLECRGSHDLGATIDGQVIQLNVAYVALKVDIDRSNDKAESGRVLSISASHGDRIKLDASPASVPDSEEREKSRHSLIRSCQRLQGTALVERDFAGQHHPAVSRPRRIRN